MALSDVAPGKETYDNNILDTLAGVVDTGQCSYDEGSFSEWAEWLFLDQDDPGQSLLAMLASYFDEAIPQSAGTFTVAGYIATVQEWKKFNNVWKGTLDSFGVRYMHMKEFERGPRHAPYDHLSNGQRASLVRGLYRVINTTMRRSFSYTVVLEDYEALSAEDRSVLGINPYSFCSQSCIGAALRWAHETRQSGRIGFTFERGQKGKGDITAGYDHCRETVPPEIAAYMGPLAFDGSREILPLQAADMVAYETAKDVGSFLGRVNKPMRPAAVAMATGYARMYEADILDRTTLPMRAAAQREYQRLLDAGEEPIRAKSLGGWVTGRSAYNILGFGLGWTHNI